FARVHGGTPPSSPGCGGTRKPSMTAELRRPAPTPVAVTLIQGGTALQPVSTAEGRVEPEGEQPRVAMTTIDTGIPGFRRMILPFFSHAGGDIIDRGVGSRQRASRDYPGQRLSSTRHSRAFERRRRALYCARGARAARGGPSMKSHRVPWTAMMAGGVRAALAGAR